LNLEAADAAETKDKILFEADAPSKLLPITSKRTCLSKKRSAKDYFLSKVMPPKGVWTDHMSDKDKRRRLEWQN
jgi:hypothetical protein